VRRRRINPEGFAALLPVIDGDDDAVRALLTRFPNGRASPFARLSGVHFARLVLVQFRDRNGRARGDVPWCLFFAAEFDALVGGFLEVLCTAMPGECDQLFGHCDGYPGVGAPTAFKRWMLDHRVPPGFTVIGNPGAADELQRCLALRQHVIDFAVETQGLTPQQLHERWKSESW
jgi:hypothetical protein